MDLIEPGIYLGNIFAPRNAVALAEANITHILSVTGDSVVLPPDFKGVRTKIEVEDYGDEDLLRHFSEANRFITDALSGGGAVLVHCVQGASRSATVLAAYLMRKHHISRSEAVSRLKAKRSLVKPNQGFLDQLDVYERAGYEIDEHTEGYVQWLAKRDEAFRDSMKAMGIDEDSH
ncbi:hypothetical protein PLICRDRAFT_40781 [Plicaturopsis crispa FD-325 SS-3]|nr:hypothetical protein PLICRDRAFT_40781 [Plicaturopsis crispa FD-325 SS-3]